MSYHYIHNFLKNKFKLLIIFLIMIASCSKPTDNKLSFKVNIGGEPASLDPQLDDGSTGEIQGQLFLGLVIGDSKTGGYKPGLAHSWDISDDGLIYTFYLREGLVWSDGVPITAEGIRKSYLRVLNKETAAPYVNIIKSTVKNAQDYFDSNVSDSELGVKAINDKTLEITLTNPKPYFLDMLVNQIFVPVPVHAIEKYGSNWTNPENMVVSGPFKLKEKVLNEKLVLGKNDKYYDAKNVALEELVLLTIDNNTILYNMYLNNEIDGLFHSIPPDTLANIELREDHYRHRNNTIGFFSFNTTVKPLDNPKVREALTLAIDRELTSKTFNKGKAEPTRNLTPPLEHYSYGKELTLFDPKRAKQLLAETGYPDGKDFPTLTISISMVPYQKKMGEFIQNQWKEMLNINIQVQTQEWSILSQNRKNGNYEIAITGRIADFNDPLSFLNIFTSENSHLASYKYSNKKYDDLIKQSDFEQDPIKRRDILRKAEEIIVEKDFPIAPTYIYVGNYLFRNDKWTGWTPNLFNRHNLHELKPIKNS
ncbi:peptide ABC transporter substrate-binding protein [Borrelia turcica IST7]|uniref:Peptide ABC transporter substrate-binding protein n=1 Tax=Borrelia turcica IST7 TaxID=1104446 RepID=A0A386PN72_9SPIR|nr:peptide ABC transporter substrate-binding protein [Borrelia turcica]AYE36210.1 peptide ABC transporter substrate-binding protein [Borrelia turcica IST7]